jgi:hypothetical protein
MPHVDRWLPHEAYFLEEKAMIVFSRYEQEELCLAVPYSEPIPPI